MFGFDLINHLRMSPERKEGKSVGTEKEEEDEK